MLLRERGEGCYCIHLIHSSTTIEIIGGRQETNHATMPLVRLSGRALVTAALARRGRTWLCRPRWCRSDPAMAPQRQRGRGHGQFLLAGCALASLCSRPTELTAA